MPYSAQTPPYHQFDLDPFDADADRAEQIKQKILVSARQLLYAYQPDTTAEQRVSGLYHVSRTVRALDDISRIERESFALGLLDRAAADLPAQRQGAYLPARTALEHHFKLQALVEAALKPVTDTGKIAIQIGKHTVGLFHKPQK